MSFVNGFGLLILYITRLTESLDFLTTDDGSELKMLLPYDLLVRL